MVRNPRWAAVIAVAVATPLVVGACGGGGNGSPKSAAGSSGQSAGGGGHLVDYAQFSSDVGGPPGTNFAALWLFDPNTPGQIGGGNTLSASDCTSAQDDVTRLESDTAAWPSVLHQPMVGVEKDLQAAITACSSGDYATMLNDITKAKDGQAATQSAFDAHCKVADDPSKRSCYRPGREVLGHRRRSSSTTRRHISGVRFECNLLGDLRS
jgi:hypothetical protein